MENRRPGRPKHVPVNVPPDIVVDMALLTEALGEPGADIGVELLILAKHLRQAVPSFTALTVTIATSAGPFSVTVPDTGTPAATSLSVQLPSGPGETARLMLYAWTPGAFVDLAADLAYALGLELAAVTLDTDLHPEPATSTVTDLSTVNQAIGVLIDRGFTVEEADRHLQSGTSGHGDVVGNARRVLASVSPAGAAPSTIEN
jgi:hypothetical protein